MKTYSEKLKDPRWQKKRLEILNRDNFTCRACTESEEMLIVHHISYDNCEPWEYENIKLVTLCEDCHETMRWIDKFSKEFDFSLLSLNVKLLNEIEQLSFQEFCEMKGIKL